MSDVRPLDMMGPIMAAYTNMNGTEPLVSLKQPVDTDTKTAKQVEVSGRDSKSNHVKRHITPSDGRLGLEAIVRLTVKPLIDICTNAMSKTPKEQLEILRTVLSGDLEAIFDEVKVKVFDGRGADDAVTEEDFTKVVNGILNEYSQTDYPRDLIYAALDQGLLKKDAKQTPHVCERRFKAILSLAKSLDGTEPEPSEAKKNGWYLFCYPRNMQKLFVKDNKTAWVDLSLANITIGMAAIYNDDVNNGKIKKILDSQSKKAADSKTGDDDKKKEGQKPPAGFAGRGGGRGGYGRFHGGRGRGHYGGRGRGRGGGRGYYGRQSDGGRGYHGGGSSRYSKPKSSGKAYDNHHVDEGYYDDDGYYEEDYEERPRRRRSRTRSRSRSRSPRRRRSRSRSNSRDRRNRGSGSDHYHVDSKPRSSRGQPRSSMRDMRDAFSDDY